MLREMAQADKDTDIGKSFGANDKDGDGSISIFDLGEVLRSMCETVTTVELDRIIKVADKDGDGEITYEEFSELTKKLRGGRDKPDLHIVLLFSNTCQNMKWYIPKVK